MQNIDSAVPVPTGTACTGFCNCVHTCIDIREIITCSTNLQGGQREGGQETHHMPVLAMIHCPSKSTVRALIIIMWCHQNYF